MSGHPTRNKGCNDFFSHHAREYSLLHIAVYGPLVVVLERSSLNESGASLCFDSTIGLRMGGTVGERTPNHRASASSGLYRLSSRWTRMVIFRHK